MSNRSTNDKRTNKKSELIEEIVSAREFREILSNLSNTKIADLVRLYIWTKLPLFFPESELIEEVIDRLEGKEETDE